MRLSFKDFVLGVGNAFGEYLRLRDVIASHHVIVTDHDQRRHRDIAQTMGRLPVVPRDAKLKILGEFGVIGPYHFVKSLHLVPMFFSIGRREISIRIADLVLQIFFKPHLYEIEGQAIRQAGNGLGSLASGGTGTGRRQGSGF